MESLTSQLVLQPDDAIDLQMHTTYSDGLWTPEQLIAYLAAEKFALVAVTDHDRVEVAAAIQQLAAQQQLPVLAAVEMTTIWHGYPTDILCYGFGPQREELRLLGEAVIQGQQDNIRMVYANLLAKGYGFPRQQTLLPESAGVPRQFRDIAKLLIEHRYAPNTVTLNKILTDAGLRNVTNDCLEVVEAAHRAGAVCIMAHPGRDDITRYSETMLDQLRQEVPLDGLEVYYPLHSEAQKALYLAYAQRHQLLISAGSDSHSNRRLPIKYPASLCRDLLIRVGIQVQ
ncbi:PHP domain-containing protein [Dictyobacter arantiisoli]|uniref:Phosphatase n=1 Tax=Dictyobacter arantiisoli TaxID=2014874 RepID=A0A5A5THC1_9CHLR|nr:PHP domain-containing protein [Dictyobacter arantiisoli]GCF10970.1 phosphatase [Dictyobacter arantiisoli]